MKILKCINCGANGLIEKNGYLICEYCNSRFSIEASDAPQRSMGMSLNSDIDNLLQKCHTDSRNAKNMQT